MHSTDARVLFSETVPTELASTLEGYDVIAAVNGIRALTLDDFFGEVARGFSFPDYFGGNWPAFNECLTDLNWLPAPSYLLLVARADLLLLSESRLEKETLVKSLERASKAWDQPSLLGSPQTQVRFRSVFLGTSLDSWLTE